MTGKLFKIIGAEKPLLVRYSLLHYNKTLYYQKNCQTMRDMAQKLLVDCKFAEDMNHIHLPHLQFLSCCLIIKNFLRNLDPYSPNNQVSSLISSHKSCSAVGDSRDHEKEFCLQEVIIGAAVGEGRRKKTQMVR